MEKKEVLVFRKQRYKTNAAAYRIRVPREIYELVESISDRTNITMNEVASMMIRFAAEHSQIVGEEDINVR